MKKNRIIKFLTLVDCLPLVGCLLAVLGCSIQADRVTSTPPNFNNVQKLNIEYGKINLTGVSIFLWPDMPDAASAVALYLDVATNAARSDKLELDRQKTQAQLDALNSNGFDYVPCFKNFELACSGKAPTPTPTCDDVQLNNDTVQNWIYKSVAEVPTDELKKLYLACHSFTDTKVNLKTSLEKLGAEGLQLTAKILYRIDPTYQKTGIQTNYKSFSNPSGSSIAILHGTESGSELGLANDQVEIRFDGFGDSKNFQSNLESLSTCDGKKSGETAVTAAPGTVPVTGTITPNPDGKTSKLVIDPLVVASSSSQITDVVYSHKNRTLVFKVPEVINCKFTGGIYSFTLERTDFGGNPRFGGDLIYTNSVTGVSQAGSAKFDGQFELPAEPTPDPKPFIVE